MVYTAHKPANSRSSEELRQSIPGWGVDLDPADRPSVPQARFAPEATGARWEFPDRQEELVPRERSIEHRFLTPVFGTSAPLHGLSGAIRQAAYERYSEGRAAHWLMLLGADRVDAIISHLRSFATLRPDNPISETGIVSELTHHGISSRLGRGRADVKHQWLDPIIVAGPWLLAGVVIYRMVRGNGRK